MNPDIRWMAIDALIKATIVLGVGAIVALAMRRAPAARKHLIWLLTSAGALLMPVLCALLPAWRVLPDWTGRHDRAKDRTVAIVQRENLPASDESPVIAPAKPQTAVNLNSQQSDPPKATPPTVDQTPSHTTAPVAINHSTNLGNTFELAILAIWLAGMAMLLSRIILSWIILRHVRRRATPIVSRPIAEAFATCAAELHISRKVHLCSSAGHGMPMTWGILRPVILLPAVSQTWSASQIRLALLHELSHIKRWDALSQLIGQFACAVYWFHPLVWLASIGLRHAQERAADDRVLSLDPSGPEYATLLLNLASTFRSSGMESTAAMAMARLSGMEDRLRAILDAKPNSRSLSIAMAAVIISTAIAIISPIAALRAQPRPATPAPTQPVGPVVRYSGRILSPDGKPVAGAEVVLKAYVEGQIGEQEFGTTQSREDGSFVFETAPPSNETNARHANAWRAGFALMSAEVKIATPKDIQLPTAARVRVVYLDPQGNPVKNLRVKPVTTFVNLRTDGRSPAIVSYPQKWSDRFAQKTDAQGMCTFDMFPSSSWSFLDVDDERFARITRKQDVRVDPNLGDAPTVIHLQAAGVITGKVTYGTTGAPAAGIRLIAIDRWGPGEGIGGRDPTVTNERGEYRIGRVGEGTYVIHIFHESHKDIGWTAPFLKGVHVTPGATVADQNLVLVKGTVVRGRVYESDTGMPWAKASVSAFDLNTKEYPGSEITDTDGRFELRVPSGEMGIYVGNTPPDGYSNEGFDGRHHRIITAVDGVDQTLDLKLIPKPGRQISGRVIDADGKPVEDAKVLARENGEVIAAVRTDVGGKFHFQVLKGNAKLSVEKEDAGTLAPIPIPSVPPGQVSGPPVKPRDEEDIVIRLARKVTTSVSGLIIDPSEKPIAKVPIRLMVRNGFTGWMNEDPETYTDANGRFNLANLRAGTDYTIVIKTDSYSEKQVKIDFTPGEAHRDMERIVLYPVPTIPK